MGGMFTALAVICMFLSGALEMNTLFFILLAAYLMGTVLYITDLRYALAAWVATLVLGFFLCSVKLYLITFGLCALYILCEEYIWKMRRKGKTVKPLTEWVIKLILWVVCVAVGFLLVTMVFGVGDILTGVLTGIPDTYKQVLYFVGPIVFVIVMDRVYIGYSMMVIRLLKLQDPGAKQ